MKKTILISLLILTCLMSFACGSKISKIEKELQGSWSITVSASGLTGQSTLTFDDGEFDLYVTLEGIDYGSNSGTYEVTEDEVILKYKDGTTATYTYDYSDGNLVLYAQNGTALRKK